jgi:hypothetical protein
MVVVFAHKIFSRMSQIGCFWRVIGIRKQFEYNEKGALGMTPEHAPTRTHKIRSREHVSPHLVFNFRNTRRENLGDGSACWHIQRLVFDESA